MNARWYDPAIGRFFLLLIPLYPTLMIHRPYFSFEELMMSKNMLALLGFLWMFVGCRIDHQTLDGPHNLMNDTPSVEDERNFPQPEPGVIGENSNSPILTEDQGEIRIPTYLSQIIPEPNSNYTGQEYEKLAPATGWGASRGGICIALEAAPLMEPGDFLSTDEFLDRITLSLNDKIMNKPTSIMHVEIEGLQKVDSETGDVIWKAPDGFPAGLCYEAAVNPGQQIASVEINKTSGAKVSYSWIFDIK